MKVQNIAALCAAASSYFAKGIAVEKRQATTTKQADSQCTHGPNTRACWTNGYSIATDFDQKFPLTGHTVEYDFEITNGTCNPDGHGSRICLLVNGQYPGPLLHATWGDSIIVRVKNSMQHNGTSIHWHGVRQYHSSGSDGVNGITECALAPGDSKTYTFQATQFGTSWYHAHYSSQYGDGVVGPMVFEGPASSNYDFDLGPYMVSDWYYQTAWQVQAITSQGLQNNKPPPPGDNVLLNGTNKNADGGGKYNQVSITKGKRYRLRLVNIAVDASFRVSLDGHTMQVITSDYIPIKPYTTQTILISIGQRYDVIIKADQTAGNYWFRANVATGCLSNVRNNALAIWTYAGVTPSDPSSTAWSQPSDCLEPTNLAPYWRQAVPSDTFARTVETLAVNITSQVIVPGAGAIFVWALNQTSINIQWDNPTLSYLMDGKTDYPTEYHVLPTVNAGQWNFWVVQQLPTSPPIPHPIHLHGHDYFVLGQGSGTFDLATSKLNYATPPRRDTATVPASGWMVLAFNSNNPGAWLMHCHIAWHVSEGLAVQFVESPGSITFPERGEYDRICKNYRKYEKTQVYIKDDSGL